MAANEIVTVSLLNCWPQPTFQTVANVANSRNTDIKPNEYQMFKANTLARLSPACWTKAMTFKPMTGRTHGMMFRISPPRKA